MRRYLNISPLFFFFLHFPTGMAILTSSFTEHSNTKLIYFIYSDVSGKKAFNHFRIGFCHGSHLGFPIITNYVDLTEGHPKNIPAKILFK